jgi:hypothetical protein
MKIYRYKTDGKAQSTGTIMRSVVEKYYLDMLPYTSLSLIDMFTRIKNLPYRPDPDNLETLMRPSYTMNMKGTGGDCDDKAIALAAWARLFGYPYRFIAIRRPGRKTLHHVTVEIFLNNHWIFCDPTYNFNVIGERREEAERVILE